MNSKNRVSRGVKLKGADKVARIPVKVIPATEIKPKPSWIRVKAVTGERVKRLKNTLRENNLYTVCEEAACPNLGECFSRGTATFMIMGDICTRRCPFCDVGHGRPDPLDESEPYNIAKTILGMNLRYVVLTSVDRDDLRDGGADHFTRCIKEIRLLNPTIQIEILTPDFRGRMDIALDILTRSPPDVFNHNLETVPRLYRKIRPGADYEWSLSLLNAFKKRNEVIPTKSGLMLGLGEKLSEIEEVMRDLRNHGVDMLTLGQYLQPSRDHLPVQRFVTPEEFKELEALGYELGFEQIASGPMVRSSYHADELASGILPVSR